MTVALLELVVLEVVVLLLLQIATLMEPLEQSILVVVEEQIPFQYLQQETVQQAVLVSLSLDI
jgi:hypothetical protein